MGKGDKKTRRGKITAGSYGKTRPHKKAVKPEAVAEKKKVKEKVKEAEEPAAKPKTTRKKKTEE